MMKRTQKYVIPKLTYWSYCYTEKDMIMFRFIHNHLFDFVVTFSLSGDYGALSSLTYLCHDF